MKKADIGIIGLAVMGENLALNFESKGYTVAIYNKKIIQKMMLLEYLERVEGKIKIL